MYVYLILTTTKDVVYMQKILKREDQYIECFEKYIHKKLTIDRINTKIISILYQKDYMLYHQKITIVAYNARQNCFLFLKIEIDIQKENFGLKSTAVINIVVFPREVEWWCKFVQIN